MNIIKVLIGNSKTFLIEAMKKIKKIKPVCKMLSIKTKYLIMSMIVISLLVYMFLNFLTHKNDTQNISVKLQNVIVHLDLKGSPPKLSYLTSLLPMMKSLGATGFLMEYEDMFPYEGRLMNISAHNRYEKGELKEFLTNAIQSGFEIIPLVQTFGHLEHVLKLAEFKHLREVPSYPDSICPSQRESKEIIQDMLEQIVQFHNEIIPLKHLHVGCDEVYHINKCAHCQVQQLPDIDIFINHIEEIKNTVKKINPETNILIWDDMLRSQNTSVWDKIKSLNDVYPVYWDYRKKIDLSTISIFNYHRKFKNIWIASAFKGADGRTATLPNLKNRFFNHFRWLNLIHNYKIGGESNVFNFKGIILTGWSRYSHFDPPCELLPSSLPSLVLNLILIQRYRQGIRNDNMYFYVDDFFGRHLREDFNKHLHCGNSISVEYFDNYQCTFDGNDLYKLQKVIDLFLRNITIGFNNINHGLSTVEFYANTNNINKVLAETNVAWCNETLIDLLKLEKEMAQVMTKYFDKSFINEYVNFKTNNGKRLLYKLLKGLIKALNVQTWPRRPYHR